MRGEPQRIDQPISNRCIRHGQVTQRVRAAAVSNFTISSPCPLHKRVQTVDTAGPHTARDQPSPQTPLSVSASLPQAVADYVIQLWAH